MTELIPASSPHLPHSGKLDAILGLTLNAVSSPETKRKYGRALAEFLQWQDGRPFTRATVQEWRTVLEGRGLAPSSINQSLGAVKKLAAEAAASGFMDAGQAAAITSVPGAKMRGTRTGNWLTTRQTQALIEAPAPNSLKGKRDRAALALMVGCGLRREEVAALTFEHIQQREGAWAIIDLRGKGGRVRSVPVPAFVKVAVDIWRISARLEGGRILRGMNRYDQIVGETLTGGAVYHFAVEYGKEIGVTIAPHDLRRTCAKLCRRTGGELEQIQLMLGHASIQTTERYLGSQQDFTNAPNSRMGLKWRKTE